MRNKIKNIITYLLLFVASLIFAHSVIPHDHHSDIASEISHKHQEEKSGKHSKHCHFFNDIVVIKKNFNQNTENKIKTISFDFIDYQSVINDNLVIKKTILFSSLAKKITKINKTSPTRGSPYIS